MIVVRSRVPWRVDPFHLHLQTSASICNDEEAAIHSTKAETSITNLIVMRFRCADVAGTWSNDVLNLICHCHDGAEPDVCSNVTLTLPSTEHFLLLLSRQHKSTRVPFVVLHLSSH